MSLLKTRYEKDVKAALLKKFNYKSVMQIPRIEKVVLNMTAGRDVNDTKSVDAVIDELALIANQRPAYTVAKKSLASFKLREGMRMGGKVTLRRDQMWDFLDKLVTVAIPRIRDFRGLNTKAFDNSGNYSLGISEHLIFPEIEFDKIKKIRGLDVIIVTSAKTSEESLELLKAIGLPFAKGAN
ncbi:50S ribosomal protein L5 [Mycoplasmopsis agassizii]|uniref:Large ribosomal subunit protein uL5 n=1 Tax=Mycoplasmopsis agassizii TaxID=33922 RepID=A0A1W1X4B1_9BACT|nr:50S ribosomal protein L5 [Mycoplasmopsis agassizii]PAF55395.1 50S ribosomal protein L5 [Mycoplasmopsis agassizii]PAK21668.1 50S ribosomal protein L5 [Mycoplasmopsis agassizii]SMC18261.1 large subunit ribosomal protein L5 [Mycoplasmopsis agassizii]